MEEKPDNVQCYKQYRLEAVNDDKYDAQVTIRFLGKRKGDAAAEYIKRWKGMFLPPEGKRVGDVAKVEVIKVSGAEVTYLTILGDHKGIPGDPTTPRENSRLLGIYFDTAWLKLLLFGPGDWCYACQRC